MTAPAFISQCLRFSFSSLRRLIPPMLAVLLTACGGGSDAPANYPIGGSVTGLSGGTLVLQVNDGETVSLSADGTFQFPTELPGGTAYVVSVQTQPNNPAQTCSVNRGSGTLNAAVNDITVRCATNAYRIGGTVSGLVGTGLVLQNNGGDDLVIDADGGFRFTQPVASGARYRITVKTQPNNPAQTCSVNHASALVTDRDIDNVTVQCSTDVHQIGGSVTGLTGKGLVLQNNAGDDLPVDADGDFQFATPVASGAGYVVTVRTQPHDPSQTCSVERATGTVADHDIRDVTVRCTTDSYFIGGTVSGLAGSGLVLQNNGDEELAVNANGRFQFSGKVASGAAYVVAVRSQPDAPVQTCTVNQSSTIVANADVTDVQVLCNTNSYPVGGSVSGLGGSSGLVLQNNGTDDLDIDGDGDFQFQKQVASGAGYKVTVRTQPSGRVCSVIPGTGSGTIGNAGVTDVQITCSPVFRTLSVDVSGYVSGSGDLILQNNGQNTLRVTSNGNWPFPSSVAVGSTYHVTVSVRPFGQFCSVTDDSGTMPDANVRLQVQCHPSTPHTIGGRIIGLTGNDANLVLQNNGGDDLATNASGSFTFPSKVENGRPYKVTIKYQPRLQADACTVRYGTGTVTGDVGDIVIDCSGLRMSKRVAYVSNGNGSVTAHAVGTDDALTKLDPVAASGARLSMLVADPQRRFAYVASDVGINAYQINSTTGALTAVPAGPAPHPGVFQTLAMHPGGGFLYLIDWVKGDGSVTGTVSAFRIDRDTGGLMAIGLPIDLGVWPSSPVIDPTGRFLYIANTHSGSVSAFSIDESSGLLTSVSGSPFAVGFPNYLAITPNGRFLYVGGGPDLLSYAIDPASGALSEVVASVDLGGNSNITALTMDPAGDHIYVGLFEFRINKGVTCAITSTGGLGECQDFSTPYRISSFAVDPVHGFALLTHQSSYITPYAITRDGNGSVISVTPGPDYDNSVGAVYSTILGW